MIAYKIAYTTVFALFLVLISDFRNKKTKPLFTRGWLLLMRWGYLIPLLCSMFFLWKLEVITIASYISFFILVCGTLIVAASKRELGKRHSWAGYVTKDPETFCVTGIYAWVRHPIYVGIMVVDIGIAFIVIPNIAFQLQLALTFLIGGVFIFVFLIVSSNRETKHLANKFGESFITYAQQVYAFFPLRKFKPLPAAEYVPQE